MTTGDYIPQTWADDASGNTPITAQRLGYMESGIKAASDRLDILEPKVGKGFVVPKLRQLGTFYAAPNIANAFYDDNYAAGLFSRYDDVVFGAGLETSTNPYYTSTGNIIAAMAQLSPNTVVWGYVDPSITFSNLTLPQIYAQVDSWLALGARGIFLDVFGYDYGVTRARQNSILTYIHSKGVGAMLNDFTPASILGSQVDATYNPNGTPTVANSSDVLFLESWIFNSDAFSTPYFATFSDIKARAETAQTYRASLGVRLYATNIILHSGNTEGFLAGYRGMAEALARIFRLDGIGVSASDYSASGTDVGVCQVRDFNWPQLPVHPTGTYHLNGPWTQIIASDLGITVNYDNSVPTHTYSRL